jgi:L-Lysine epsilon oxidase N-terminal/L-lysine epsilon oxidase C-terminal domain
MNPIYRIHPAIGVARVGNAARPVDSGRGFFVGPELPDVPANFDPATGQFGAFKLNGKVKAQAARFRIWEYVEVDGKVTAAREINLGEADVVSLKWTVRLANRKASFFEFNGQQGANDDFATNPPRNSTIHEAAERAQKLEMEEERTVSGRTAPRVELRNSKFPAIPIETLGELRTDGMGRLLVLGGVGTSKSIPPGAPLPEYANNDGWFDDVSDGPVTAVLTLRSANGSSAEVPVEGAWVLVGPPDFAPSVGNVVRLYDTLWDVAARQLSLPGNEAVFDDPDALLPLRQQNAGFQAQGHFPDDYRPSFAREIWPILRRAFQMGWVHEQLKFDPSGQSGHHHSFAAGELAALADPNGDPGAREDIFNRLQEPGAPSKGKQMPRSLGDEPYLKAVSNPLRLLTLTRVQYEVLRKWKDGKFVNVPAFTGAVPPPAQITPWGLDRAALENCVGGALYPGIEAGWLMRKKEIYSAPFRIRHGAQAGQLKVRAGFFSQQMALPWQADFMDCKKEKHPVAVGTKTPKLDYAWWPGQRPDDVFVGENANAMVPWARTLKSHEDMVGSWFTRGFVISKSNRYFESEGPPV